LARQTSIPPATGEPSKVRRLLFFLIFGGCVFAIVGGTIFLLFRDIVGRLDVPRGEPKAVLAGSALSTLTRIDQGQAFPYAIAKGSDGALYLSVFGQGAIRKIDADGRLADWQTLTAPGALVMGPNNLAYVIDYSVAQASASGRLKKLAPNGRFEPFGDALNAAGVSLLSQMALDANGNLYVTVPTESVASSKIWRVQPDGFAAPFITLPPVGSRISEPLGIAYDAISDSLVVADAGTNTLYRIPLATALPETLLRENTFPLATVAVGSNGAIYFSVWAQQNGQIFRLDAGQPTLISEGHHTPLGLLAEADTLYVVGSDLSRLPQPVQAVPPFTVDAIRLP
jgi:sugar lactone lactonase YvrE